PASDTLSLHAALPIFGLIAGHTEEQIREIGESIWEHRIRPRLWPETVALAREHLAQGHQVWLVSATPVEVAQLIAEKLGLTGARSEEHTSELQSRENL